MVAIEVEDREGGDSDAIACYENGCVSGRGEWL